jgi:hypothetical protein
MESSPIQVANREDLIVKEGCGRICHYNGKATILIQESIHQDYKCHFCLVYSQSKPEKAFRN